MKNLSRRLPYFANTCVWSGTESCRPQLILENEYIFEKTALIQQRASPPKCLARALDLTFTPWRYWLEATLLGRAADGGRRLRGLLHHRRRPRGLPGDSPCGVAENKYPAVHNNVKISKFLQIFGGLVLGCIKTKFCKILCVGQHFSSSTRFASFCTAAISKFSQKIGLKKQQFS